MKKIRFSGLVSLLVLSLAACADDDAPLLGAQEEAVDSSADADAAGATAPAELAWRNCGAFEDRNLECAEVIVPVDYDQPDGDTLAISVRRIHADPLEPYHGALLFNPGGPGGEGIDVALSLVQNGLFNVIAPGYDIIGFDPRGVASSGELGCGALPENLYPGATPTALPAQGIEDYVASYKASGERCEREWGVLFRELGSNNVVRDMEEIRKALGQPVLNFLGASYGTRIGALYAHNYPETTGRIVLDGAVHPQASLIRSVRAKFNQAVALHDVVMSRCESGELVCPPDARTVFSQLVENARQRGILEPFVNVWTASLAYQGAVAQLIQALNAEVADPGGEGIFQLFAGAGGGGGEVALQSVNCTDDNFEPPTIAELESLRAEFNQTSPLFAEGFVQSAAMCAGWPVTRDPVPSPLALDAAPLLVIGGTFDARTPYEWSQAMTEAVGNATLLTSTHYGHVAFAEAGDCVRFYIRAYLTSGSLPASGTVCAPD